MTKFSVFVGLVSLSGLVAAPTAQFRSTTELVSVDAIVTSADGQPATGLNAGDFVLRVDGKVRPIASVQFVRFNETAPGAPHLGARAPAALAVPAAPAAPATNTDPKGRAFIFAIDHNNIHAGNERPAIDAAIRLLDQLTPNDRVAVVTLPRGGAATDLTTNREETRKALEGIIGHAPRRSSQFGFSVEEALATFGAGSGAVQSNITNGLIDEMVSRECTGNDVCAKAVVTEAREYGRSLITNTRDTILALGAFMKNLSTLEGTKSIVFISEGLVETADNSRDFNELGRISDAARVRMFVIQLTQPTYDVGTRKAPANANGDIALELAGLENIAGVTGGELFRASGRVDSAMQQIDHATSAYYLVGFEPTDKERDGKYHRIELTLARKDLRIRSRGGFEIASATKADKDAAKKAPDATALANILHDTVRDYRDLPMRTSAFAFRDEADRIKVLVVAETLGTGTMTKAALALISESGGMGAEWTMDESELVQSPVVSAASVAPGRYRARVAATDALGRRGAVDVSIDAALTPAGPLLVSDLLTGGMTGGAFQPRLAFAGEPAVTGFLEIYNVPLLAGVPTARLELAATAEGPALAAADMTVAPTPATDRRIARGTVSVPANAPAGPLVLRAEIQLNGQVVGRILRVILR